MFFPKKIDSRFDLNANKIFYNDKPYLDTISKFEILARP
jgi:hypothetical protein